MRSSIILSFLYGVSDRTDVDSRLEGRARERERSDKSIKVISEHIYYMQCVRVCVYNPREKKIKKCTGGLFIQCKIRNFYQVCAMMPCLQSRG